MYTLLLVMSSYSLPRHGLSVPQLWADRGRYTEIWLKIAKQHWFRYHTYTESPRCSGKNSGKVGKGQLWKALGTHPLGPHAQEAAVCGGHRLREHVHAHRGTDGGAGTPPET